MKIKLVSVWQKHIFSLQTPHSAYNAVYGSSSDVKSALLKDPELFVQPLRFMEKEEQKIPWRKQNALIYLTYERPDLLPFCVTQLKKSDVDVSVLNANENSIAHIAALHGKIGALAWLKENTPDIFKPNLYNLLPLEAGQELGVEETKLKLHLYKNPLDTNIWKTILSSIASKFSTERVEGYSDHATSNLVDLFEFSRIRGVSNLFWGAVENIDGQNGTEKFFRQANIFDIIHRHIESDLAWAPLKPSHMPKLSFYDHEISVRVMGSKAKKMAWHIAAAKLGLNKIMVKLFSNKDKRLAKHIRQVGLPFNSSGKTLAFEFIQGCLAQGMSDSLKALDLKFPELLLDFDGGNSVLHWVAESDDRACYYEQLASLENCGKKLQAQLNSKGFAPVHVAARSKSIKVLMAMKAFSDQEISTWNTKATASKKRHQKSSAKVKPIHAFALPDSSGNVAIINAIHAQALDSFIYLLDNSKISREATASNRLPISYVLCEKTYEIARPFFEHIMGNHPILMEKLHPNTGGSILYYCLLQNAKNYLELFFKFRDKNIRAIFTGDRRINIHTNETMFHASLTLNKKAVFAFLKTLSIENRRIVLFQKNKRGYRVLDRILIEIKDRYLCPEVKKLFLSFFTDDPELPSS